MNSEEKLNDAICKMRTAYDNTSKKGDLTTAFSSYACKVQREVKKEVKKHQSFMAGRHSRY